MDVTRENIDEALQVFESVVAESDFVAVDAEFSGLHMSPNDRYRFHDSPQDRYSRARDSVTHFQLLQLGFCAFSVKKDGEQGAARLVAHPFNVYLMPPCEERRMDQRFVVQASSFDFLARHRFDFNKVFHHGVPYLSYEGEKAMRDSHDQWLERRQRNKAQQNNDTGSADNNNNNNNSTSSSSSGGRRSSAVARSARDIAFVEEVRARLSLFAANVAHQSYLQQQEQEQEQKQEQASTGGSDSAAAEELTGSVGQKRKLEGNHNDDNSHDKDPCVMLEPANGFLRLLVYQLIDAEFPGMVGTKVPNPRNERRPFVRVTYMSADDKAELDRQEEEKNRKEFEDKVSKAIGARRFIDIVSASGKPIVGHNMLLDSAHMFHSFVECAPPSLSRFKYRFRQCFRTVFDTKYIADRNATTAFGDIQVESTTLGDLCAQFEQADGALAVAIADGFDPYANTSKEHDAAYDAYLTGTVFARMAHVADQGSFDGVSSSTFLADNKNRIFLMRSGTNLHLDCAETFIDDFSDVFFVSSVKPRPIVRRDDDSGDGDGGGDNDDDGDNDNVNDDKNNNSDSNDNNEWFGADMVEKYFTRHATLGRAAEAPASSNGDGADEAKEENESNNWKKDALQVHFSWLTSSKMSESDAYVRVVDPRGKISASRARAIVGAMIQADVPFIVETYADHLAMLAPLHKEQYVDPEGSVDPFNPSRRIYSGSSSSVYDEQQQQQARKKQRFH